MTTNKDIYALDEKAIIVGIIPDDAPAGYAVLIKVTGPVGDCATENTLPRADNSFRSRPIRLDECGLGEFTVSAFYADQKASSTFKISNSSLTDAGSKLELRTLKSVMLQALDAVNTRVKELVQDGYVLPEEVADKYSEGVSEASLALQAIEFGDAAEAKKHMIFAIPDFREVLKELSSLAKFEEEDSQQATSDDSSVVGAYNRLQDNYDRLEELAETNHVDKEDEFKKAAMLLSNAKRMIEEGNYEGAERNLEKVDAILEEITAGLYDEVEEKDEKLASDTNSTSQVDEKLAKKLTRYENYAAELEKKALELFNQTGSNSTAAAKVQEALALIESARTSIQAQDLESAKIALSAADDALDEAEDMIKHDDENEDEESDSPASDSSENSDDNSEESSKDESEEENDSSSSGGSDEDEGSEESSDKDDEGSDNNSGTGRGQQRT